MFGSGPVETIEANERLPPSWFNAASESLPDRFVQESAATFCVLLLIDEAVLSKLQEV
jgi:hypothetical protein